VSRYSQITGTDNDVEGSWFIALADDGAPISEFTFIPVETLPEVVPIWSIALCIPAALLVISVMGNWKPEDLLRTFPIIFVAAIAFHRFSSKPSGMSDEIAKTTG